jgi:signal peptidase I
VDKLAYRAAEPRRGDLVVARAGRDLLVKRVVGLPGEELELRLGELFVNRLAYAEFYPLAPGRLTLRPGRLLADRYALLGDNRDLPTSIHAVVSRKQIVGKVVRVWRPWPRWPTQDGDSTA